MDISLKNLLLAGLGAMSYTYEKGADIIEELVKKGEITVSQAKDLNDELKRKVNTNKTNTQSTTEDMIKKAITELNIANKEDIKALNERLTKLENK